MLARALIGLFLVLTSSLALADDPPSCTDTTGTAVENDRVSIPATCDDDVALSGGLVAADPTHGDAYYDIMGDRYIYVPRPGFSGTDSFTFQAMDSEGQWSEPATAAITVAPLGSGSMTVRSCYMQNEGCNFECDCGGYGINSIRDMAMSRDGKNLYTAANYFWQDGGVSILNRDPGSGALSQPSRPLGCITYDGSDSGMGECGTYANIKDPHQVIVSPDDRNVYVLSTPNSDSESVIVILDRNQVSGSLSNPRCFSRNANPFGCTEGHANFSQIGAIGVSPDGKHVYAVSNDTSSVMILARDASTGNLSQDAGEAGCLGGNATPGACADGLHPALSARKMMFSADGSNLYIGTAGVVYKLDRNPQTGLLSQDPTELGCLSEVPTSCGSARGLASLSDITLTGDETNFYISADMGGTLAQLDRSVSTGLLSQPPGPSACFSSSGPSCQVWTNFSGAAYLAVDPQGENLLSTVWIWDGVGSNMAGLQQFKRGAGGTLTRVDAAGACLGSFSSGCLAMPLFMTYPGKVIFSPDGTHAYVEHTNSIVVVEMNRLPECTSTEASVHKGASVSIPLACTDSNGDTITRIIAAQPAHGALGEIDSNAGTVTYTADGGYQGDDSFTFRASDGTEGQAATVSINVTNTAPTCSPATLSTEGGVAQTADVVCTDADGDFLSYTVSAAASNGTVSMAGSETAKITYTPAAPGTDSFIIRASDGAASADAVFDVSNARVNPKLTLAQQSRAKKRLACGRSLTRACRYRANGASRWTGTALPAEHLAGRLVTLRFYKLIERHFKPRFSLQTQVGETGSFDMTLSHRRVSSGTWMVKALSPNSIFLRRRRAVINYMKALP